MEEKIKWGQQNAACLSFLLIFIIILTCQNILQCQPIFSPGVVITATGDTLRGEIGEFGNGKNYQECVFRQAAGAALQHFTPSDIKSYMIDDRRYFESRSIAVVGKEVSTVFIEWILKGSTSLFKTKSDYYILDEEGIFQIVPFTQYAIASQSSEGRIASKNWLQFLNNLALNCPTLDTYFKEQKNLSSTEKNLIYVIKTYNECQGTAYIEYAVGLPFFVVDMGISVAVDYAKVTFKSPSSDLYTYLTASAFSSIGPAVGLPMLIRSPRRANNLSFYFEPSLRYFHINRDIEIEMPSAANRAYYYTALQWFAFGSPLALRYTFPNTQPAFSVQFGPQFQFLLGTKENFEEELLLERNDITLITINRQAPFEIAKHQFGYGGQINLSHNWRNLPGRWSLSLGFQHGNGILSEDALNTTKPIRSQINSFSAKTSWFW